MRRSTDSRNFGLAAALVASALLLAGCAAPILSSAISSLTGGAAGTTSAATGATTSETLTTAAKSSATQSAVTEGAKTVIEDRSAADQARDLRIAAEIAADILGESAGLFLDVSADVWEQRVMLTGRVEDAADKARAMALVAAVEGVREIHDDIQVRAEDDQGSGGIGGFVDDKVIATKIEANLLTASGVSSLNYRWRSVDGRVSLLGRALDAEELAKVERLVSAIDHVETVVSHVEVRPRKAAPEDAG